MKMSRPTFTLLALALTVISATVHAQDRMPSDSARRSTRAPTGVLTAGGAFNVSQPRGVFDETTNLGFGLSGNALFRLDPEGIVNVRAEAAYQIYGNVSQRVPLSTTVGNLIQVDLRTTNNILSFVTGPQLLGPSGAIRPYVAALGGFSAFWTSSSVEGTDNVQSFASTTNSSDFAWAYGGAAGAYVRLTNGQRPLHLELGMRYLRHDDVTYLTADEVRASVRDRRDPLAIRSRVDFYSYYVGVQAVVF